VTWRYTDSSNKVAMRELGNGGQESCLASVLPVGTEIQPYGPVVAVVTFNTSPSDVVTPEDYGAVGDGIADDTDAINAALLSHRRVVARKKYRCAGKVVMGASGLANVLDGEGGSIIADNTTLPAVALTAGIAGYGVVDLEITRNGIPTAGANGIQVGVFGLGTTNRTLFRGLKISNQWMGAALQSTDYSEFTDSIVEHCYSHGVYMTNAASYGPAQWHLRNILAQTCAGTGFRYEATNGPPGAILGEWVGLKSFANGDGAIRIFGTPSCGVNDVRILGGFFGGDNGIEIHLDTYGYNHLLQDFFVEYSGASGCGPGLTIPANGLGTGINLTTNNHVALVTGVKVMLCAEHGLVSAAHDVVISGGIFNTNNRVSAAGGRHGIYIIGGSAIVSCCRSGNLQGANLQSYGLVTEVDSVAVTGNDLRTNATGEFFSSVPLVVSTVMSNLPRAVNIQ
jgi:hypothetical protein